MSSELRARALALAVVLLSGVTLFAADARGQSVEDERTERDPRGVDQRIEPPVDDEPDEGFDGLADGADAASEHDREREYVAIALDLGGGRDSGFVVDGVELDDDIYRVRPSIVIDRRPSRRTQFLLAYEPEAEFFDLYSDLDSIEHAAGLQLERGTGERSQFTLGASLLDGEDPGRKLDAVLLVLPRTPYRQIRAWTSFEHRWARTEALFALIHTDTVIEAAPGLFGDGIDQTESTAAVTLTHALARRLDLIASYAYSHPDSNLRPPTTPGALTPVFEPVQTLTLGVARHLRPTLSLFVSGGAAETAGDVSALAALELVRSGRDFGLRLRYDLSLLSLGLSGGSGGALVPSRATTLDTAFPDSISHTLGIELDLRLGRRVRWVQSLRGTTAELPGDEDLENYTVATRLVFEVLPRLAPYVQGELLDQSGSALLGDSFTRYHVTAGFVVGLSGPPDTTGVRGRSSSLDRVLPAGRVY